jgi:electron-transferring-flavoprotein dehydrogenase
MTDPTPIRPDRTVMPYDVVIVGAGPSGLSCAIRLKQLDPNLSVCILEKGSEVGAHLMSGAVFEPRALNELFPDWQARGAPLKTPAGKDGFYFMTKTQAFRLLTPPQMHNKGNYIISLGELGKWLAQQAEQLGVEIFAGFPASELLYDANDQVIGVATGDVGIDKHGQQTSRFTPGVEIHARHVVLAEGCHGSLTKKLIAKFNLRKDSDPQTYGLGIKEIWEISKEKHQKGLVFHSIGWPMDMNTYGGSWMYHYGDNLVSIGMVVGLDYKNPYLSPFEEMQRFKTHPFIKNILSGGRRISYGGRALNEGGFQSIPQLTVPGALMIGDTAGFLNTPKIKGNHTAMKSGMLAAEAIVDYFKTNLPDRICWSYPQKLKTSWVWKELHDVRNIRPGFNKGLLWGLINAALETYIFRGRAPWTLRNHADYAQTAPAKTMTPIAYLKPDGVLTFDRLTSVSLSNTNHAEDQPAHLKLRDPAKAIDVNYNFFASPETRYCPAAVYEIVNDGPNGGPRLQINAQNCIHCKTCDIKDPTQNIDWTVPEGGGGPRYTGM